MLVEFEEATNILRKLVHSFKSRSKARRGLPSRKRPQKLLLCFSHSFSLFIRCYTKFNWVRKPKSAAIYSLKSPSILHNVSPKLRNNLTVVFNFFFSDNVVSLGEWKNKKKAFQ